MNEHMEMLPGECAEILPNAFYTPKQVAERISMSDSFVACTRGKADHGSSLAEKRVNLMRVHHLLPTTLDSDEEGPHVGRTCRCDVM